MTIEQTRRKNCIKLLLGLTDKTFKVKFNMRMFAIRPGECRNTDPREVKNECGTSACLLGHGPLCGIRPETCSWTAYSREFVPRGGWLCDWNFLFSGGWSNSIIQAVGRLHKYLKVGVPRAYTHSYRHRLPNAEEIAAYRLELKELETVA